MLKHQEDDGDLSVIAGLDEVLLACNKGHYWVIPAEQKTIEGRSGGGSRSLSVIKELSPSFGPGVAKALGLD